MYPRRRSSTRSGPRDYFDKVADAMGEGAEASSARAYARGSGPLRLFIPARSARRQKTDDAVVNDEGGSEP